MYDIIVFGSDISSLTAASLSASKGLRTCLLREDSWVPSFAPPGFSFETDPSPWTGFHAGGIADVLLDKLGFSLPYRFCEPSCQIALPLHRVSISRDYAQTAAELTREFHDSSRDINLLMKKLQTGHSLFPDVVEYAVRSSSSLSKHLNDAVVLPCRFARLSSFRRIIAALYRNPALSTLFGAYETFFSYLFSQSIPPSAKEIVIPGIWQREIVDIMGGNKVFYEELLRSITTRKGRHLSGCTITDCSIDGPVIEITVSSPSGEQTVTAPRVIISCPSALFDHIATQNAVFAKKMHRLPEKSTWRYPYTLHMAVREQSLPEQLARHSVIIGDHKKSLFNGNAVHLYTAQNGTDGGEASLHITTLIDFVPHTDNSDRLHAIARSMHDTVSIVVPFLGEGTVYCDVASSITHAQMTAHTRSPRFPVCATGSRRTLLSQRMPYKNVFLTGPAIIPRCGFEGDIASGIHAAYLAGGTL